MFWIRPLVGLAVTVSLIEQSPYEYSLANTHINTQVPSEEIHFVTSTAANSICQFVTIKASNFKSLLD